MGPAHDPTSATSPYAHAVSVGPVHDAASALPPYPQAGREGPDGDDTCKRDGRGTGCIYFCPIETRTPTLEPNSPLHLFRPPPPSA